MILTDDNFATIEAAVEEGRGVFDNLTKFIVWIIPTNLGEALMLLSTIVLGLPLPLLPLQLLWINLTDTLLGLSLAFEPKEGDVMSRPPRRSTSAARWRWRAISTPRSRWPTCCWQPASRCRHGRCSSPRRRTAPSPLNR